MERALFGKLYYYFSGICLLVTGCAAGDIHNSTPSSVDIPLTAVSSEPTALPILPLVTPTEFSYSSTEISTYLRGVPECQLPCWFGIIPGKTSWQEAEKELSRFADNISYKEFEEWDRVEIYVLDLPEEVAIPYLAAYLYIVDSIVEYIVVYGLPQTYYYVGEVLETFETPTQVYLHTLDQVIAYRVFELYLAYEDQGILFAYSEDGIGIAGELIEGCMRGVASISLWDASNDFDAIEASNAFGRGQSFEEFLPIDVATSFDVEVFSRKFRGIEDTVCLSTPRSIWLND